MRIGRLIARDLFTLHRPAGGADTEGNPIETLIELGPYGGTWGSCRAQDREYFARRGQTVHAVVAGKCLMF